MFAASQKESVHLALQLLEGGVQRSATGIENYAALRIQLLETEARGFPKASLDSIADHGLAQCARRGETDLRSVGFGPAEIECGKERPGIPGAMFINISEILGTQKPYTFRKTCDTLPLRADGELLAAARAPARKDCPSVGGLHTREKSVRLRTPAIVRLKRSLRHLFLQ